MLLKMINEKKEVKNKLETKVKFCKFSPFEPEAVRATHGQAYIMSVSIFI